ncbi:MAG: hypothetical protein ABJH98_00915 [Reichenbachiella sp.]
MDKIQKLTNQQNIQKQKSIDSHHKAKQEEKEAKKMAMVMQLVCW